MPGPEGGTGPGIGTMTVAAKVIVAAAPGGTQGAAGSLQMVIRLLKVSGPGKEGGHRKVRPARRQHPYPGDVLVQAPGQHAHKGVDARLRLRAPHLQHGLPASIQTPSWVVDGPWRPAVPGRRGRTRSATRRTPRARGNRVLPVTIAVNPFGQ